MKMLKMKTDKRAQDIQKIISQNDVIISLLSSILSEMKKSPSDGIFKDSVTFGK